MYTCNHAAEDYHDACSDVMMVDHMFIISIVCMHLTMRIASTALECMDRKSTTIIGVWLLFDTGFAYKATLNLAQVGCHPHNREKQMIILANVQALMKLMAKDGYNEELFKGWVQEGPIDATDWQDQNARLFERSEGYLASSNTREFAY